MNAIKLMRRTIGPIIQQESRWFRCVGMTWDELFNQHELHDFLLTTIQNNTESLMIETPPPETDAILAPVEGQEIWGAGVTYHRSRDARMAESEKTGGGAFYDLVYEAARPELFYKGSRRTAVGTGATVHIRSDSLWNVPEPELTLAINAEGSILGFTIGNDMSSRDIEGANPLYLPQAKTYDRSCALGPCILLGKSIPENTAINMIVTREDRHEFTGTIAIGQMRRSFDELISYLFRENTFPDGCFLMTGTGIVPPDAFSLRPGDEVTITIETIGSLINGVDQYEGV